MTERTILYGDPSSSGPATREFMAVGSAQEGYQRLSLVTGVLLGVIVVILLVWLIETMGGVSRPSWEVAGALVPLAYASVVFIGSRRKLFPVKAFVPIALATEVLIAIGLTASILGWQNRLDPETLAWLATGAPQPLDLGAGHVPWAGLWIVLFATLIPIRPIYHLIGASLSALTLFIWPFVSVAVHGFPPQLEAAGMGYTLHIAIWLFFRGAIAAGMAYFAARSVYGLRESLAKARRMGSYHLREKLGEGGMGEVWKADHHMLARSAAIKLIKPEGDGSSTPWHELTGRFQREVRATAQLRSPHTIEVYDYGLTEDGTFYYVMELLDGLDLEKLVKTHGPVGWQRAVHILKQICHSLGEAHERGLVHRDIKPANVFLCRIGRDVDQIKVLDFGLVKTATPATADSGLTQQGMFVGTPAYTAPEMASSNAEGANSRSDIYSLGCVAFWLLSGNRVFQAETPLDMLIMHAREEPTPPSQVSELEIPPALDRIVLDCLAKDPEARPPTADELAKRLGAIEGPGTWTDQEARAWWARHRSDSSERVVI